MQSEVNGRIVPLDGLRGIACLMVLIDHSALIPLGSSFMQLGGLGPWGVRLFMVFSGFFITRSLLLRREESNWLRSFYINRIGRIFLPYYIYLLVVCVVNRHWPEWQSIFYLTNYYEVQDADLIHTWSLSVEEQFYAFWPIIFIFPAQAKRLVYATVILSVVLAMYQASYEFHGMNSSLYKWTQYNMILFAMGGVFSFHEERARSTDFFVKLLVLCFFSSFLFYVFSEYYLESDSYKAVGAWLIVSSVASFAISVVLRSESNGLAKIISWRPFVWVGGISYGLYVYHPVIFNCFNVGANMVHLFFAWFVVFAVAVLSMKYVENPVRKWIKAKYP